MIGNVVGDRYIAVIQAGGKGTRMRELTKDRIPKPLLRLNGKPMLQWQIENISRYGIQDFVIIVGHLGEKIQEYFGDGSAYGVHIAYIAEETDCPLGSAGALYYLKQWLCGRNVFLVYGDIIFDIALERMLAFHESMGGKATLLVHPNAHPYDSDLVILDASGKVAGFDEKGSRRDYLYENIVNAGIYILTADVIETVQRPVRLDFEKNVLKELIQKGQVYGYRTPEYVKDAGTPERFSSVSYAQREGLLEAKNLAYKQKCIFLDRDGTLNVYRGLITETEQIELEEGAAAAVRRINQSEYLVIVVTNQPVVARGMCSIEDVENIHKKLSVLLGVQGAFLDDIMFCPHHPDKGYPEENPAYKILCNCRKPGTAMIEKMAEKYHIDLSQSYMIGDTTTDIQTGINAGLKTVLLQTGEAGKDGKYEVKPDMISANLLDAVEEILGQNSNLENEEICNGGL
ncbi:MAG: HAD-IIIA family hydrolase [Clostridium sp.]|nr:HAD-IIIA family hydrolase [Roseburia sp.]MCM1432130.1 HAD-IIIA family hydrolase [Muribaculaceae bacterium]MCM1499512.1 HAD-IIIA family hydrolase [Clostridium sp.]